MFLFSTSLFLIYHGKHCNWYFLHRDIWPPIFYLLLRCVSLHYKLFKVLINCLISNLISCQRTAQLGQLPSELFFIYSATKLNKQFLNLSIISAEISRLEIFLILLSHRSVKLYSCTNRSRLLAAIFTDTLQCVATRKHDKPNWKCVFFSCGTNVLWRNVGLWSWHDTHSFILIGSDRRQKRSIKFVMNKYYIVNILCNQPFSLIFCCPGCVISGLWNWFACSTFCFSEFCEQKLGNPKNCYYTCKKCLEVILCKRQFIEPPF